MHATRCHICGTEVKAFDLNHAHISRAELADGTGGRVKPSSHRLLPHDHQIPDDPGG
jgi:hypothetical protein